MLCFAFAANCGERAGLIRRSTRHEASDETVISPQTRERGCRGSGDLIEVIAGDHHRTIRPGSNATKVELTRPGQPDAGFSAPINSAPINAAEREQLADATQRPAYPLLAQHMNVQGSVVLQAVIGADGIIQDLHVLSGPAILAAAAQQAGFRACLRWRPDATPGSPEWNMRADVVARAIARGVFAATALPFPAALPSWKDKFG